MATDVHAYILAHNYNFHFLLAAKESGERKLPHRLVLAEFLSCLAKIYTLEASYDKFLNTRQLKFRNALRYVRKY